MSREVEPLGANPLLHRKRWNQVSTGWFLLVYLRIPHKREKKMSESDALRDAGMEPDSMTHRILTPPVMA